MWLQAISLGAYQGLFHAGGVSRGSDLQELTDGGLEELGVRDEVHRLVILECVKELVNGSSTVVSEVKCVYSL